ncbi:putative ribosomal protein S19/S15 [Helianthus anomalus]
MVDVAAAGAPKKRTFKKFNFRGVDLDALLDMSTDEHVKLFTTRACRSFRGVDRSKREERERQGGETDDDDSLLMVAVVEFWWRWWSCGAGDEGL